MNQLYSYSPALDLQDASIISQDLKNYKTSGNANSSTHTIHYSTDPSSPINILLVNSGDIIHVLKTMAVSQRHQGTVDRPINIYILEENVESIARQLLLYMIFNYTKMPPRVRIETFWDLYANLLTQQKTNSIVKDFAKTLKGFVQDIESSALTKAPVVPTEDFNCLSNVSLPFMSRSFSALADHLSFLSIGTSSPSFQTALSNEKINDFNAAQLYEYRLRGYYGDRFDGRNNLIDWDYHYRLKEYCSILHIVHYKRWRNTGLAYEKRECSYTVPNRSFASYRQASQKGRGGVEVRGYWSDCVLSPYLSLGIECDDITIYETRNNQHLFTSVDVMDYNLMGMLYEVETGNKYTRPKVAKQSEPASITIVEEKVNESNHPARIEVENYESTSSQSSDSHPKQKIFSQFQLHFLHGSLQTLATKKKFAHLFHRVFLSQYQIHMLPHLDSLIKATHPESPSTTYLSIDTIQYYPMKSEEKSIFIDKLTEKASAAGWTITSPPDQAYASYERKVE